MWAILALGAALLTSFNPILYKWILKDVDPITIVWTVTLLGLPLLGVFTLSLTPHLPRLAWIFLFAVIASAGLNVVAHVASTRALKLEDVSLVTPMLTFSPAFTVLIAAVFLNETPSMRGLTGAGLLWAITPIFEKVAIQHTAPSSPQFAAFVVEFLLVLLLTVPVVHRDKSSLANLRLHRRELFLAGLIAGSAPILGYTAFSLGFVGYVTTMFKFSSAIMVIWAALFLKEHDLRSRLSASLLMVAGGILITA